MHVHAHATTWFCPWECSWIILVRSPARNMSGVAPQPMSGFEGSGLRFLVPFFFYRAGTTCTGRTVKTMDQVSRRLMWRVLRNKKLTTNAGKEIVLVMVLKLINGGIFASPNCCLFFWIQKDPCMAYLPTSRQTNTQKIIDCNKEKIQNMFSCDAAERYY